MERELNTTTSGSTGVPADDGAAGADGQALFLDLLLRDAPAVEYERPVLRARARGDDPEVVAALEAAKMTALRVRSVMRDRRRRESELGALFETANDLAGMRSLDQVLQAIVERARNLLGTDTAYLTLSDPEAGGTYMRVTSGSVSAAFQRLRLAPGKGLGGLVATTALPYVTANYFADPRFTHAENIDHAVRDEGLVAILGVPLKMNGRDVGVLFAANRRERPFAHSEVALLSSLAAHAAIAIDSANLIDDTRRALDELHTVNERLQRHTASVERSAAAHDRLTDLVLRGGGVREVAAAVAEVLGGTVLIHDATSDSSVTASPEGVVREGVPWDAGDGDLAEAVRSSLASGRAVRAGRAWVATAAAGTEPLGTLVLRGVELDSTDQRVLERSAMVTALLLLIRRSVSETEHRLRGDLLDELLEVPARDPVSLRQRAALLHADLDAPHVLVVAEAPGGDPGRLRSAATHVAETTGGLAGSRSGRLVLALPGRDPSAVGRRVADELSGAVNGPVTAGLAGPTAGPASFGDAFAEAARCLQTLRALGREGDVATTGDLGFSGLLLSQDRDVPGFVSATLGPLLEYDARRGTLLVETLRAYFAAGGNLSRAKEDLHIHVNTVAQRLERIGQLIGADWQRPGRALELQLALHLHGLLDRGVDLLGDQNGG
ncbi:MULTISPECIES: helix-turn-helix domain-containing protein [Nocardiopsis]|uniref:Transcriptional regulator, CdaR n=1 Tax=Nocardiopsis dassonvillei (strain ATCC 23218 / DSM 43111 / CIP 107115 / JCM 7437 / KCTC 9190 / NBRC 14626 / NCTC 10488 / NRRL B-5397 / IMRU 509) TaxID=446468 RepID=D7B6U4_NOCDD|nr:MULTISPECIES: GAF domain-containing protein [Nocardiopsis]ADH65498.1 transcriptional regulator, CdaR [Nocardiopsis dassonvillei subsp. dassonvillei DSM 43111]NKY82119.1 GAF domain-containing protein [Nocardiopsis dassonvillei]VEI90816.1 fused phosphoenolpyruvate-protein phosphotransferase PtsP/GAF domain [Nocardiopsis dassonvillei]